MFCIFGVCVPYSVLWPLVLIVLKPVWEFLSKYFGLKVPAAVQGKSSSSCCAKPKEEDKSETSSTPKSGSFHLTEDMDFYEITQSDEPTLVRLSASWCKPCKIVEPVFYELADAHPSAKFVSVDVDKFDAIAADCGAISIPRFVAFRSGKNVGAVATSDKEELKTFVALHATSSQ